MDRIVTLDGWMNDVLVMIAGVVVLEMMLFFGAWALFAYRHRGDTQ